MSLIKSLASQSAIYGLSSIVGRLLNYLLVPMYTRVLAPEAYGVVTQYYALSGFLLVLLSYRMESAFFRFGNQESERENAFSTAMKLILGSTALLLLLLLPFVPLLSAWMGQAEHPEYLYLFAGILATDVLCELPFARLRMQNRSFRFAGIKLINIGLNISLNLFFLLLCPYLLEQGHTWVKAIYQSEKGIYYIFLSNLIAGLVTLLLLGPEWLRISKPIDWSLVRRMMVYSLPLVIVSMAGVVNEMLDRLVLPKLLSGSTTENLRDLGIYGANYKIAVLIALFTQAYRYAAEPFFFKHAQSGDDGLRLQAQSTKWFTIVICGAMLGILLCLDIVQNMVGAEYRSGITIVPILLTANVLLGIYYNFSIWFRLRDRTQTGAWISVAAAIVTVASLYLLVPRFGYQGAAWATLVSYLFLVIVTWYTGRAHYPAPYALGRMLAYFLAALGLFFLFSAFGKFPSTLHLWAARVFCLSLYLSLVWLLEKRLD
jgi:O-antigen/teichoic acid export membrane protein